MMRVENSSNFLIEMDIEKTQFSISKSGGTKLEGRELT